MNDRLSSPECAELPNSNDSTDLSIFIAESEVDDLLEAKTRLTTEQQDNAFRVLTKIRKLLEGVH